MQYFFNTMINSTCLVCGNYHSNTKIKIKTMLKFDKEQVHWQALDSGAPKPVSTSSWATQENLRGDEPELETFEHEGALSLL